MKKEFKYILVLCLIFGLYYFLDKLFFSTVYNLFEDVFIVYQLSYLVTYIIVGLPIILFVYFTNGNKIIEPFGLKKNILKGIFFSFLFSVPMFIGFGLISNFEVTIKPRIFWFGCVFAAFFEEFYYRGFFFGQVFKKTKLGFFPSLILSAIVFASLHLYQSNELGTMFGIFITTFMGAGFFAWLYVEWNYNLWVSIGMHFFMNLSWEMFSISDNALGGVNANLIRATTILVAVLGTILYKKILKIPLTINKYTLITKR